MVSSLEVDCGTRKELSSTLVCVNVKNQFEPSARVIYRCCLLSKLTDVDNILYRSCFTDQHIECNKLVATWMYDAGMSVVHDDIGNVVGTYTATDGIRNPKILIIGSHLDTVINAGKFDGILGVLTGIEVVSMLNQKSLRLPYTIKVIGFSNEEGVRFPAARTGSKAIANNLSRSELNSKDSKGVSFFQAQQWFLDTNTEFIHPVEPLVQNILGYIEVHIEQGPVLNNENHPIGIVTAIQGADRLMVHIRGESGHAGTVPNHLRKDAMLHASRVIGALYQLSEKHDLMLTIGSLDVTPGAVNIIPGRVSFSIDARSVNDKTRRCELNQLLTNYSLRDVPAGISMDWNYSYSSNTTTCSKKLSNFFDLAIKSNGYEPFYLISGAGHDALSFSDIAPISMLFVQCKHGVSHVPEEDVDSDHLGIGINVLENMLINLEVNF